MGTLRKEKFWAMKYMTQRLKQEPQNKDLQVDCLELQITRSIYVVRRISQKWLSEAVV